MKSISNPETIPSPALLFDPEVIGKNLDRMIEIVEGKTDSLRPHVKTHKTAEIVKMQVERGIHKTKCATIAEAELCALAGSTDVLMAYPPVGPNIVRIFQLVEKFPDVKFSAVCDDFNVVQAISNQFAGGLESLDLFIDLNPGMNRTGILPGEDAAELAQLIDTLLGIEFAGVHAYDGHIHDAPLDTRESKFTESFIPVWKFIEDLKDAGIETETIVTGGSPTMAIHAQKAAELDLNYECSAGTPALWDAGYQSNYPELGFTAAASLFTRVISKPGDPSENLLCLDLGYKAVAAENPLERRVRFPDFPDAEFIQHSEEHLVIRTVKASQTEIGTVFYATPWHICPSVALYEEAVIIRDGEATGETWEIKARKRRLTI